MRFVFGIFSLALLLLSGCGGNYEKSTTEKSSLAPAPSGQVFRFLGARREYLINKIDIGYSVQSRNTSISVNVPATSTMQFNDFSVNFSTQINAKKISSSDLNSLIELYIAFFNRVPDADGLNYWVYQIQNGMNLDQIADSFYKAAVQYSSITGYSSSMSNADFVKVIYKNVLGRSGILAPPNADVEYWANLLSFRQATKGKLVSTMLFAAHSFNGDPTWGWVDRLLTNKIKVAQYFCIEQGLTYNSVEDSIIKGMAIAAAVTDNDIDTAKFLIGVDPTIARGTEIPSNLWLPNPDTLPTSGNYIYLVSDPGDFVGKGASYLYTNIDTLFLVKNSADQIDVSLTGNESWDGTFQVAATRNGISKGYYSNITRYPFSGNTNGGLSWIGEGRGCSTRIGWFAIDKVEIKNNVVTELDMRFAQHCEGSTKALRGIIHWTRKDDIPKPNLPVVPIPSNLWQPQPNATPAAGSYVYLQSERGDYIGGGESYKYTKIDSVISLQATEDQISVWVGGNQSWHGTFKSMKGLPQLQVGYYGNLKAYPFHNPMIGGIDWGGEARACNASGWFAIDSISYSEGMLKSIEMRFEQHCENILSPALRGKIKWDRNDTTSPPGPVFPIPSTLWRPLPNAVPTSGSYVYMQSEIGDFVGGGLSYTFMKTSHVFWTKVTKNTINFVIHVDPTWSLNFQAMDSIDMLRPGYYGELRRYSFHNHAKGGLDVEGNNRGCNRLTGWFVIDKITWVSGQASELEMRFEQYCEGSQAPLRGQIHWYR